MFIHSSIFIGSYYATRGGKTNSQKSSCELTKNRKQQVKVASKPHPPDLQNLFKQKQLPTPKSP